MAQEALSKSGVARFSRQPHDVTSTCCHLPSRVLSADRRMLTPGPSARRPSTPPPGGGRGGEAFSRVWIVEGGLAGWRAAGLPVERLDGELPAASDATGPVAFGEGRAS